MAQFNPVVCLILVIFVYTTSTFHVQGGDQDFSDEELLRDKRSSDNTTEFAWKPFKPSRDRIGENCYLNKTYETVWPYECNYYLKQNTSITIPCQPFCNLWVDAMRTGLNLTDDCKYHDWSQPSYCTAQIPNQCSLCDDHTSALFSTCCGTCIAVC